MIQLIIQCTRDNVKYFSPKVFTFSNLFTFSNVTFSVQFMPWLLIFCFKVGFTYIRTQNCSLSWSKRWKIVKNYNFVNNQMSLENVNSSFTWKHKQNYVHVFGLLKFPGVYVLASALYFQNLFYKFFLKFCFLKDTYSKV